MSDIDDDDINLSDTDSIAPFDDLAMTKRSMRLGGNRSGKATSGIFASVMKAAANVAVPAPTPPAASHAAGMSDEEEEDVDFDDADDDDHDDDEFGFLDGEAAEAEPDDDWMRALDGTVKSFHFGSTRRTRSEPAAAVADGSSPGLLGVTKAHGSFTSKLRIKLEQAAVGSRPTTSPATSIESPANGSQSVFAPRPSIFMQDPDDAALARLLGKPSPAPTEPPPNRSPTPPAEGDDLLLLDEQEAVNVVYRRGVEMAEAGARRTVEDDGLITLEELVARAGNVVLPFWTSYPAVAVFECECIAIAHTVEASRIRVSHAAVLIDAALGFEMNTRSDIIMSEDTAFAKFVEQRAFEANSIQLTRLRADESGLRADVTREEAASRWSLRGADLEGHLVVHAHATETAWRDTRAVIVSDAADDRRRIAIAQGMGRIFELESAEAAARRLVLHDECTAYLAACGALMQEFEVSCRTTLLRREEAAITVLAAAGLGTIAVVQEERVGRSALVSSALTGSITMTIDMTVAVSFTSVRLLAQAEERAFTQLISGLKAARLCDALLTEEASMRCGVLGDAAVGFLAVASRCVCELAEVSTSATADAESALRAQILNQNSSAVAEIRTREALAAHIARETEERAKALRDGRASLFGLYFTGLLGGVDLIRRPIEANEVAARAALVQSCRTGADELRHLAYLRALGRRIAAFDDQEARARLDVAMVARVEFGLLQARARVATADAALDRCTEDEFRARRALHALWLLQAAELHKRGGVEAARASQLATHRVARALGGVAVEEARWRHEIETHRLVSVKALARPMQGLVRCVAQEARLRSDMAALREAFFEAEKVRMQQEALALRVSQSLNTPPRVPTPPTLCLVDLVSRPRRRQGDLASASHHSVSPVSRTRLPGNRAAAPLRSIDVLSEEFRVRGVWETQEARVRALLWRLAGLQEWELRDREALQQRWVDDVAVAADALRRGLEVRRGVAHGGPTRHRAASHSVRPLDVEVGPRPSTVGALPPVPPAAERGRHAWARPVSRVSAVVAAQRASSGLQALHQRAGDALPRSVALAALCYGPRPPTAGGGGRVGAAVGPLPNDRSSVVFPGIGRVNCLTS
jgi:hypothetical protein